MPFATLTVAVRRGWIPICAAACLAFATSAAGDALPVPAAISPGSAAGQLSVATSCPTFSWAGVPGAEGYQLEVSEVDQDASLATALTVELPPGVLSWRPPIGACLPAGKAYSWAVRSHVDGVATAWSDAAHFQVSLHPDAGEVLMAWEILRAHQAALQGPAATTAATAGQDPGMTVEGRVEARDLDVVQEFVLGLGTITAAGEIESRGNTAISGRRLTLTTPDSVDRLASIQSSTPGRVLLCTADTGCEAGAGGDRASLRTERLIVYDGIEVGAEGLSLTTGSNVVGSGGAGFFEVPSFSNVNVDDNASQCPSGSIMVGVRLWETDADQIGVQVRCTNP